MNQQPFVSIATPVYNGEKFIEECINSVINQNYQNWEYIIINNCSTDKTLDIALKYANLDNRIRVITNKSLLPIVDNFNVMIKSLSPYSKYCKIVHADDFLFPECVKKMVQLAEKHPHVGVVGSYHIEGDFVAAGLKIIPYPKEVVEGKKIVRFYMLNSVNQYYLTPPSLLLLRSDLIRKRKIFYKNHLSTDLEASYDLLCECDYGFVHQVLVYIRSHEGQESRKVTSFSSLYVGILSALREYGQFYLENNEIDRRQKELWREYYHGLAYNLLKPERIRIYEHSIIELEKNGFNFSRYKLGTAFLRMIIRYMIQPFDSLKKIQRHIKAKP